MKGPDSARNWMVLEMASKYYGNTESSNDMICPMNKHGEGRMLPMSFGIEGIRDSQETEAQARMLPIFLERTNVAS